MSRQVLLVEAGSSVIAPLYRALSSRGFSPTPCRDGREALHRARQQQPDLILLAGSTAEPGSDDLCRALKLQRTSNLIPLVLIRAAGPVSSELRVEPDAELDAPWRWPDLARAIEQAFAMRYDRQRDSTLSEVRFLVPSDPDKMEEMQHLLGPWLGASGLGPFPAQQTSLAAREVVANAMEWAHGYQSDRLVSVACRLDTEKVSILVRDSGAGFDRDNLPHAARPGDPTSHLKVRAERNLRDGGFGILMASGLVDHLCYNDSGNEALLVKYLPHPRSPRSARRPKGRAWAGSPF
jgi:anti-sigma regulatory factor (Ser/Thr protein kinase)/CheY-like chemotaxis protein